jgi:D-serine dehydratase
MELVMNQEEIQQQIALLTQQIQQRGDQIARQDPLIARLSGQIEVYRTFIESEVGSGLVNANEEEQDA